MAAEGLFWMKTKFAGVGNLCMPPLIVTVWAPTLVASRIPPLARFRVAPGAMAMEAAAAALNRNELMVVLVPRVPLKGEPSSVRFAVAMSESFSTVQLAGLSRLATVTF